MVVWYTFPHCNCLALPASIFTSGALTRPDMMRGSTSGMTGTLPRLLPPTLPDPPPPKWRRPLGVLEPPPPTTPPVPLPRLSLRLRPPLPPTPVPLADDTEI